MSGTSDESYVEGSGDKASAMESLVLLAADLRRFVWLFALLFVVTLAIAILVYVFSSRTYEADAVIGPPPPSPTSTMLASVSGMDLGSLASSLLSGNSTLAADPFQEYLQLMPSTRLSEALIRKDHILQIIYSDQWDPQTHRWKTSWLRDGANWVKAQLGLPVNDGPNVDSLSKYFESNLVVDAAPTPGASSLLPGTATFMTVQFKFEGDRHEAEVLLNTILLEADQIIRDDQRKDVIARVGYLERRLAHENNADERGALIQILSSQEQLLAMVESDHRYASSLVVVPYASTIPTSPPTALKMVLYMIVSSLVIWVGLVMGRTRSKAIARLIGRFERKPKVRAAGVKTGSGPELKGAVARTS